MDEGPAGGGGGISSMSSRIPCSTTHRFFQLLCSCLGCSNLVAVMQVDPDVEHCLQQAGLWTTVDWRHIPWPGRRTGRPWISSLSDIESVMRDLWADQRFRAPPGPARPGGGGGVTCCSPCAQGAPYLTSICSPCSSFQRAQDDVSPDTAFLLRVRVGIN